MGQRARWIRIGIAEPRELLATLAGFALAQPVHAAPIVAWGRATAPVDSELLRADAGCFVFALIAPRRLAPGRAARWPAWVLAPALAACRALGLRAWADGAELRLAGVPLARAAAAALGACALASASLESRLPGAEFEERTIESLVRSRLEAQHGWEFDHSWPNAAERAAIARAQPQPLAA
jgi:hypothetical protein